MALPVASTKAVPEPVIECRSCRSPPMRPPGPEPVTASGLNGQGQTIFDLKLFRVHSTVDYDIRVKAKTKGGTLYTQLYTYVT
jgi:hypothetical protein